MTQAANPYAPPASAPAAGFKQCDSCGEHIREKAEICPKCGVRQRTPVSKTALLLLTFFFGGIGAHKFYLGKYWQGAFYLIFFWTWLPTLFALVEFIIYAFTSSERLNEKYSAHGSVVVIVVVIAIVGIAMIGILAAVAIPAYQDYTKRARVSEAMSVVPAWRVAVEQHYADHRKLPSGVSELRKDSVPAQADTRHGSLSLGANGALTLTMSPATGDMAGRTLVFQAFASPAGLTWDCTGGTLQPRYRMATCRAPR